MTTPHHQYNMTQKEASDIMYNSIPNAGRVSSELIDGKIFMIFKSDHEDLYMVICVFENSDESFNSDVLYSIQECNQWIEQQ
jgi:hypothetical protein